MGKADEFIKRGIIIGLAIVTIGGAVLPPSTAYAATTTTSVTSVVDSKSYVASTGHITSIKDDVGIGSIMLPIILYRVRVTTQLCKSWYTNDTDTDPCKECKDFYL